MLDDFWTGREMQSITIEFGKESRTTTLYKKNDGSFVYWNPFTGDRVVINKPLAKKTQQKPAAHPEPAAPNIVRLPKHPTFAQRQLEALIKRDGLQCHWCKRTCDPKAGRLADLCPTREHVIRSADGGSNGLENLVLACRKCNNSRHNKNFDPTTESRKRA